MKAFELQARPGFDSLTLVEHASAALGPFDVRVRVRAVSLNYRDLMIAKNAANAAAPFVPVSDGAGEVVEVGSRVTRHAVGARVVGSFFPTWIDGAVPFGTAAGLGGGEAPGMLAEEVVLCEDGWVAVPETMSFESAASLPCAGVTAFNALHGVTRIRPGDVVLVQGTGGVSLLALQLAKAAGASVIVTTSDTKKASRARELGADHVIDYRADATWGESALAWTGGRGVDVVVEVGGPATFDQSVAAARPGGVISLIGVLTGFGGEIALSKVFAKRLQVQGIYVGSTRMLVDTVRAFERNALVPVVDRTFSFAESRAAFEYVDSAAHFGKVVIRV